SAINDVEEPGSSDVSHEVKSGKGETLNAMWETLSNQIYQFLDGITLSQFTADTGSTEPATGKLSKTASSESGAEDSQAIA
ncbi:MAG: hypothetical protein KAS48_09940, partial [Gammaproteobacteria bacterium]|nr:hypothetical protein [Gammaproteobacteria bacterium]